MQRFPILLIKPSHYDDDGYVIQWFRSAIPSNSLAVVHGLALDCKQRRVLGDDVDIVITALDEDNTRIRPDRIARQLAGGRGVVMLVGVQSNQFPRAMDIARPLRAAGVQVCLGGFHVSGCLSMLPGITPELQEAMDLGVSLFAGAYLDPDLNNYDLEHVTTAHPRMSAEQWQNLYHAAWREMYSVEHMETVLRRAAATGISVGNTWAMLLWFHACVLMEKVHPLQGGLLRRKYRRDRRPTRPVESPFVFYPRYLGGPGVQARQAGAVGLAFPLVRQETEARHCSAKLFRPRLDCRPGR